MEHLSKGNDDTNSVIAERLSNLLAVKATTVTVTAATATGGQRQVQRQQQQQQQPQPQEDGDNLKSPPKMTTTTTTVTRKLVEINKLKLDGKQMIRVKSSSLNDYLIKLTMFLVITLILLICSHQTNRWRAQVNCQKHFFHNNNHLHHHHHHQTTPISQQHNHHQYQYPHQQYPHNQQYAQNQYQNNNNHHHQQQLASKHEHILLNERQALDHLMRSHHSQHHHHFVQQQPADRRNSGAFSGPSGSGSSAAGGQQQQHQADGGGSGKLLVCYYTTRQSAPFWPPSDARSYQIMPADEMSGLSGGLPVGELRQESGFAPMLQYEPYVSGQQREREQQQQQQQPQQQQVGGATEFGFVGNMKNQQQQLVFKSAAVVQPSSLSPSFSGQNQLLATYGSHYSSPGAAGNPTTTTTSITTTQAQVSPSPAIFKSSIVNGGGGGGNKYHQEAGISQMLVSGDHLGSSSPQQQQQQQSQSLASTGSSFSGGRNASGGLKGKQILANAGFIGSELELAANSISGLNGNNNGLIVSAGGQSTSSNDATNTNADNQPGQPAPAPAPEVAQRTVVVSSGGGSSSSTGNNGNFIISGSTDAANNNGGHLERSLLKQQQQQQQQIVFSPSLSRAFIVGGSVGVNSAASTQTSNNEALDTKSQLFIPLATQQQQQQQQPQSILQQTTAQQQHNYYLQQQQQQQQVTTTVSSPLLYQQQQQQQQQQPEMVATMPIKGKSLQQVSGATNSEQLSPAHAFSGAVSSAPSVPLSPASTAVSLQVGQQQVTSTSPAASSLQQQQQQQQTNGGSYQLTSNSLQTPFLPNSLIVIGAQQQQQQQTSNAALSKSLANNSPPGSQTNLASSLRLSSYADGAIKSPGGSNSNAFSQQQQQQSQVSTSAAAAAPSSGSTTSLGSTNGGSSSSSSSTALLHLPSTQAAAAPSSSLMSAASSSPLSTMFDVFGAAHQYLMRFKPSSLISPSSFVFNAISNANHHTDHSSNSHSSHSLKSASSSSSSSPGSTTTNSSSSLLSSLAASSGSLIPLPFSSSLIANLHKSSSSSSSSALGGPHTANDRSSSSGLSSSSGSGILSRFSLSQSNQRREDVCGRTIQTPQRRIIGGEGARYGEFPYQVHIKIAKHQCGGALVDKQSIVTAAHCVYHFITRAPVSKLQIVIGAYDIEDEQYQELPPQYFKVNKVKLHPNFRFSASHPDRYDIAILKLDKPVKYTDNVLPVCLPSKELKFESMVGTVTGFGKTDPSLSNRYGTRLLQKVDVPIIENNECERWHRTRGIDLKIFPEMMCAGYEDGLKDACVGDSGGPLVVKTSSSGSNGSNSGGRWTLAGITSAGFGCAQSRQPGIYHRVSHTVDWILENLD